MAEESIPRIDAQRVLGDLRELARRTGDEGGAQRLCWTQTWRDARDFLRELLGEIGLEAEQDAAGNLWASLGSGKGPGLVVGSHIDSVPDGGWLDGALGAMTALGVMRAWASHGSPPPRPLRFVDWADEEGARFGNSLYGSSAAAGNLDPGTVAGLRDAGGEALADVLAANGVDLAAANRPFDPAERIAAFLELHIEQGPVLEAEGRPAAAVDGCAGIERWRFRFKGQASHAGTTPMDRRADAGLAAAEAAIRIEAIGIEHGGMATTGRLDMLPGIATAVAGGAELLVDLRHRERGMLTLMLNDAHEAASELASARNCSASSERIWGIDPTLFDPGLVDLAAEAVREVTGSDRRLTSGALHDAAQMARVAPATMIFVPSIGGISHAAEENTPDDQLVAGIEAYGLLAGRVLAESG